jgi:hypothetical protein
VENLLSALCILADQAKPLDTAVHGAWAAAGPIANYMIREDAPHLQLFA